jgi:hypothetical protein
MTSAIMTSAIMTPALARSLLAAAAIGFIGCGLGLLIDPATMLASYLVAWTAVSAIAIGALAVLFTSYLVRGGWTEDLHEPLTGAGLAIPAVALLFVPVIAGMSFIYPWVSEAGAFPAFKAAYLAPWFFVLRAVCCFAIWTALAVWAARAYGNDAAMTRSASAGLIIWTMTASWAGIDWLQSVEPDFHSSIYGLLAIDFYLLAGFAFGLLTGLASPRPCRMSLSAYSGVLLSVLLLWAYMHAMQYIIIWTGNIPEEVVWYLRRLDGGWGVAFWVLIIGQFIVPFFALLSETIRSSRLALLWLAGATLALRFLEAAVLILPPLRLTYLALLFDLPAAILMTGAIFLLAWRAAIPLWQRWSGRAMAPAR